MSQMPPTPLHGAAYAETINAIGGPFVLDCPSMDRYRQLRGKLDDVEKWAAIQVPHIRRAYAWGITQVDNALRSRAEMHENSRAVQTARQAIPKPPKAARPKDPEYSAEVHALSRRAGPLHPNCKMPD